MSRFPTRLVLRLLGPLSLLMTASCAALQPTPSDVEATRLATGALPVARWDHVPQASRWTSATLEALDGPGAGLVNLVPADIETWCPSYVGATAPVRKAFWVGLLSALAKHESTWRPEAAGGGGLWFGLLQIAPATARNYGCAAKSADALKNGEANLRCAVRIMGVTVPRDGVIAAGGGGVAADWGPFHQASKRAEMAAWTRSQPYCAKI